MASIDIITTGLKHVDPSVTELMSSVYDSTKAVSLSRRLGTDLRNMDNYLIAGRLWMYNSIRPVSNDIHRYVKVNKYRLSPVVRHFMVLHADAINAALSANDYKNYTMFDILQATTLTKGYLLRASGDEEPTENPEQMFMRIAVQLYHELGIERVLRCYGELSDRRYVPASPTIFNSGTGKPQLSSCFLLTIEDDLKSILYTGVGDAGMISKHNGGLGFNLQFLRHSEIGDTGMSSGLIPFARIYDHTIDCVDQGGRRKGAGTAFIRPFHIDVEAFIRSTNTFGDHTQRLFNLNTCLWMSGLFFERVKAHQKWTLFCPARAKVLNELYGYEFEQAYLEMEKEAEKREEEYAEVVIRIKGLESYAASLPPLPEKASAEQHSYRARLQTEISDLRAELAITGDSVVDFTSTDSSRKQEVMDRLFGLKNRLLANPTNETLAEQLRTLQERRRTLNRARITHVVIPDAHELLHQIAVNQINSSMPYIMHADSVNAKSNHKNLGPVNSSNLCVAPETLILTREGEKVISEASGTEVEVWNGECWSKVTVVQTGTNQKLVTVKLSNGKSLDCTPYHKFLIPESHYCDYFKDCNRKEAKDLKFGDALADFELPNGDKVRDVTVAEVIDRGRMDDTYCFKEPINNAGVFNGILTGQCLEVTERSGINPETGEEEIASCNLSSMNLPKYVVGKLDWKTKTVDPAEIVTAYDFDDFGKAVRSATENLDRVIALNYYPLDERDESGAVVKRGKISKPNLRNRPIGLGVSGLADVYYALDIPYTSERAKLVNKMIFACMYFNSLAESLRLAIRDGAYETFRTGSYKKYAGLNAAGKPTYITCEGSPLANGQFQFDMWAEEAQLLSDLGRLTSIYNRDDDVPIDPLLWGQKKIVISETTTEGEEVEVTLEPSWDSLRSLIMKYGTRHSLNIALMPTATSAQILGNLESTEAPQTLFYSRKLLTGNFTVVVPKLMEDLTEIGLNTPDVISFILGMGATLQGLDRYVLDHPEDFPDMFNPVAVMGAGAASMMTVEIKPNSKLERVRYLMAKYQTMFEMSQKDIIQQAAARGRYVCQSQSLNIYLPSPTPTQLIALHSYTFQAGLKTGMYYLRQQPAVQVASFNGSGKLARYIEKITNTKGTAAKLLASALDVPAAADTERGCGASCTA